MKRKGITLDQLKNIADNKKCGMNPTEITFTKEQDKNNRVNTVNNKSRKILKNI